jgi:hypothetical protein
MVLLNGRLRWVHLNPISFIWWKFDAQGRQHGSAPRPKADACTHKYCCGATAATAAAGVLLQTWKIL